MYKTLTEFSFTELNAFLNGSPAAYFKHGLRQDSSVILVVIVLDKAEKSSVVHSKNNIMIVTNPTLDQVQGLNIIAINYSNGSLGELSQDDQAVLVYSIDRMKSRYGLGEF